MLFSSISFLYVFILICLPLYFLAPGIRAKNVILTVLSLLFYAWGEPIWLVLLVLSSLMGYLVGLIIHSTRTQMARKLALVCSIVVNLGLLGVFKYAGFLVENINLLLGASLPVPGFALPIGISFYTFQTLSYSIDIYSGKAKLQRSFLHFLLYVSLFPQLMAGPIVRYTDIQEQITGRTHSIERFAAGLTRFVFGLSKKLILANHAGEIAAIFLDFSKNAPTPLGVWYGVVMFALQIYFDFSGYSDMAIGLGKMFGFDYLENFDYPYIAKSVTDFWRRWHMSLSGFFRDYVYIPLGGNRRWQIRNIAVVWFLTGIWHGASWNFILWGAYYGILLIFEKLFLLKWLKRLPAVLGRFYAVFTLLVGWVIFYFTDSGQLWLALRTMFGFAPGGDLARVLSSLGTNLIFLVAAVIACMPVAKLLVRRGFDAIERSHPAMGAAVETALTLCTTVALLVVCTALLAGQSFQSFLYFRF